MFTPLLCYSLYIHLYQSNNIHLSPSCALCRWRRGRDKERGEGKGKGICCKSGGKDFMKYEGERCRIGGCDEERRRRGIGWEDRRKWDGN